MLVCEDCFNDAEIQSRIKNENQIGNCDVCQAKNVYVANVDVIGDFITEFLDLFKIDEKGENIITTIQRDWDIFANIDIAKNIIAYFLQNDSQISTESKVTYIEDIQVHSDHWDALKDEIRTKTRFHSKLAEYLDEFNLLESNLIIKSGSVFYRARLIPSDKKYLTKAEMGCPPVEKTPAGRANPVGIPYLYLCKERTTTLYEIRAVFLDRIAIGEFQTKRDLNILDFTANMSLFMAYYGDLSLTEAVSQQKLKQHISNDLSRPLRRYDTELEYVPTQSICEYCKLRGIDGIMFRSSLHEGGLNIVLFNPEDAKCIKVYNTEVIRVEISES